MNLLENHFQALFGSLLRHLLTLFGSTLVFGDWSAIDNKPWITVTSSALGNVGLKQVTFTVEAFAGNIPRSGEISINGKPFTVIQTPNFPQEWGLSINPSSSSTLPVTGDERSFGVNISSLGRWTTFVPNSKDSEWIKLPSSPGNSGTYLDTLARFMVLANQGAAQRTGTIIIGDKSYTVTQSGGGQQAGCNYQLSSIAQTLGSGVNTPDTTGSFQVSVETGCMWNATNSDPSWLEITGGSGNGDGTVSFRTRIPNSGSTPKTATVTVDGKPFYVTQNASQQSCSRTINPISRDVSGESATGIVDVSSTAGCVAFTANSNVGWISVAVNNASQMSYIVQENNTTAIRSGTITVAGQIFTINQAARAAQQARRVLDFDRDGKADVSVFRPSNGGWYIDQSMNGFTGIAFGQAGDKITPADYDGDGKTDVAVFRPSNGTWYLNRSQLGFTAVGFGIAEDIPQPADFDNDGKAELAVFRPSNGYWYVLNLVNNQFSFVQFGQTGDKPVVSDYDGDGIADYAVYRNGSWYIQRSSQGFFQIQFGEAADRPVPADYDGDGRADVAVFRPSNGTWHLNRSTAGFAGMPFGISTDVPAPADYDGDGRADIAVFRPSNGTWYLNRSTAGFTGVQFGLNNDIPVPSAFVP